MLPPSYENAGPQARAMKASPCRTACVGLKGQRGGRAATKQEMRVDLDYHFTSKIYTTGSKVSGEVIITPVRSIEFHSIVIQLIGEAKTYDDGIGMSHRTGHRFLQLEMPMEPSKCPASRMLEPGTTYKFPFNFIMPMHLASKACTHRAKSEEIRQRHLRLPPSLGTWEKDDMTPHMARIEYVVRADVFQKSRQGLVSPLYAFSPINFVPMSFEDPPLDITKEDELYALEKTKKVRRNLFSSVQGRFGATAMQAAAINLSKDGHETTPSSVSFLFSFESRRPGSKPPQFKTVSAKLQAHTWFRGSPMHALPNLGSQAQNYPYSHSVSIPLNEKPTIQWVQQQTSKESQTFFYTAKLDASFTPKLADKILVPTFHSCIISREYTVRLVLQGDMKLELTVPVQVAMSAPEEYYDFDLDF